MSNQSRKVRDSLVRLKESGIITPEQRDPRQCWLLVIMHPADTHSGEVFVTHAKNFDKFAKRKGFEIIGHGFDQGALTMAARKLTISLGANYQPKFSAFRVAKNRPATEDRSESQDVTSQTPDDYLDAIGLTGDEE